MSQHPDPECEMALRRLLDALCTWERNTGRESLLVLIPVEHDEPVVVSDSGKPLGPAASLTNEIISERVEQALAIHDDPDVHRFLG